MSGNFRDDPKKASEAGRKGGEHSRGHQQQSKSSGREHQQGAQQSPPSDQRGATHEQHSEAGKQSHKNR